MSLDFLPFSRPSIGEDEIAAVEQVLRSGWITTGPKNQELEQRFADTLAGEFAGGMDRVDIGDFADLGEIGLAGQREHLGDHGLVQLLIGQHGAQGGDQTLVK